MVQAADLADDGEFARVVVADVTVHGQLPRSRYVSAFLRYASRHALKEAVVARYMRAFSGTHCLIH